ncbi:MAG: adenylate/guanylate cyclase domain-containing protein [Spirochaetes bacterium]|nr:adenylate/guanylate cyclase domain-containing protein [Spirochaetota bacterium]
MRKTIRLLLDKLVGDAKNYSLEHRLFNSFALLNGVSNTLGSLNPSSNYSWLFLLNLGTGLLFVGYYVAARFYSVYRILYWPFVFTMEIFLFFNILGNAGSLGGAHYYYIPLVLISTILSRNSRTTLYAAALSVLFTVAVFAVEMYRPQFLTPYAKAQDRLPDIVGQFLFVQILCATTVIILKNQFNVERDKSDRLLRNILPDHVADELKKFDKVQSVHFDNATVLFTDMVGFTKYAENLPPAQLVAELDGCFKIFDQIVRELGLEKIKTIGDSYMAASGIPIATRAHAVNAVLAGLRMQSAIARLRPSLTAQASAWQIRVGIHSGPLVAGVIGSEKFSYDIWGDTVNTASRMESSGAAGRVNISRATFELVKEFFECEYRGRLTAKNKGEIEMYFVNRIKSDYASDADGFLPNAAFSRAAA